MTKFTKFATGSNDKIRGFRLTFTPDANVVVSGWPEITEDFGIGPDGYSLNDLDLSPYQDVSEVSFCITQETGWFASTKTDIEQYRFKNFGTTSIQVSAADGSCNNGANDDF